jgi:hypothetical protein
MYVFFMFSSRNLFADVSSSLSGEFEHEEK